MNHDIKTQRVFSWMKRYAAWLSVACLILFVCIPWTRISKSSEPPRYIDIPKDADTLLMVGDYENDGCKFIHGMNGVIMCGDPCFAPMFFVHLSDGSTAILSEPTLKPKKPSEIFVSGGKAQLGGEKIHIYDENDELRGTIPLSGHNRSRGVVPSENGSHLVVPKEPWMRIPLMIHYSEIEVWDTGKIAKMLTVPVPGLRCCELPPVALNSHCSMLAVLVKNELQCWDFLQKKELFRIRPAESEFFTGSPSFSKDGKYLMINSQKQPAMVFDSLSGEFRFWFLYHKEGKTLDWAMVTPDGRYDGTEGMLQFVKIWCEDEQLYLLPSQTPSQKVPGLGTSFFPESQEWYLTPNEDI